MPAGAMPPRPYLGKVLTAGCGVRERGREPAPLTAFAVEAPEQERQRGVSVDAGRPHVAEHDVIHVEPGPVGPGHVGHGAGKAVIP